MCLGAIYAVFIADNFIYPFEGFLITVGVPIAAWAGIFAAVMLGVSYYWFLRSVVVIDARGMRQTWMFNREVEWRDVRSAKMIGIPWFTWLFPPRLVVRTGTAFVTFNGGSRDVLVEFARISLAYQMKK